MISALQPFSYTALTEQIVSSLMVFGRNPQRKCTSSCLDECLDRDRQTDTDTALQPMDEALLAETGLKLTQWSYQKGVMDWAAVSNAIERMFVSAHYSRSCRAVGSAYPTPEEISCFPFRHP